MQTDLQMLLATAAIAGALSLSGCSSTTSNDTGGQAGCPSEQAGCPASAEAGTTQPTSSNAGTVDLPATGTDAEVRAWLGQKSYATGTWKCESAPHDARSPSPHGKNRICSNATLSAHGAGAFPVGAAAVKELYDETGATVVGHAIYRKVKEGAGEAFYWWEDNGGSTVANGNGDDGAAKSICVGCHAGAGSDAKHSGHDLVYTQVK